MSVDDVLAEKYRFREAMVDALRGDLVGPGEGDDEVIGEAPLSRYIIGALWPQPADEEDAEATELVGERRGLGTDHAVHGGGEQRQLETVGTEGPGDVDVVRVPRAARRNDRDVVESVSAPPFLSTADFDFQGGFLQGWR